MMRTQKFQKVFDRVVRQLGRDPLAEVPQDMSRSIVEHMNDRVEQIHQAWDWPEWTLTEERAFRPIWNATHQWQKVNTDGGEDEVFYLGTAFVPGGEFTTDYGYYRVKSSAPSDPPIGTVPTNTTYWEAIEQPIDAYVAYDQVCRRAIGRVIGVYRSDPRLNGSCGGLWFRPSEKGIDVRCSGNSTVFISYFMPLPVYTIVPYVSGKMYARGDVVFDPSVGECFQAVTTTNLAPGSSHWIWIPFLSKWATYVVQGAFADCLMEFDQAGNTDLQAKALLSAKAEQKADTALMARVDELTAQGQVLKYGFCKQRCCDGWCESIAFSGGPVTTLTEDCQDDLGWVYPTPQPTPAGTGCDTSFHSEIVAILTSGGTPSLEGLATTSRAVSCTLITIVVDVGGSPEAQAWRLVTGAADPLDSGQLAPADYNVTSNNKHWVKVG